MSSSTSGTPAPDLQTTLGYLNEILEPQLARLDDLPTVLSIEDGLKFAKRFARVQGEIDRLRRTKHEFEEPTKGFVDRLDTFIRRNIRYEWATVAVPYQDWLDKNGTPDRELKAPPAVPSPAHSKGRGSEAPRPVDMAAKVVRDEEVAVTETSKVAGKRNARIKSKAVVESEGDDGEELVETPTRPKPRPILKKKESSSAAPPRDTTPASSNPVLKAAGTKRKTAVKSGEGERDVKRRKGRGVTKAYAAYLGESTHLTDVVYEHRCEGCRGSNLKICVGAKGETKCHGCAFKRKMCVGKAQQFAPRFPDAKGGDEVDVLEGFEMDDEGVEPEGAMKGKAKEVEAKGDEDDAAESDEEDSMDEIEEVPPTIVLPPTKKTTPVVKEESSIRRSPNPPRKTRTDVKLPVMSAAGKFYKRGAKTATGPSNSHAEVPTLDFTNVRGVAGMQARHLGDEIQRLETLVDVHLAMIATLRSQKADLDAAAKK